MGPVPDDHQGRIDFGMYGPEGIAGMGTNAEDRTRFQRRHVTGTIDGELRRRPSPPVSEDLTVGKVVSPGAVRPVNASRGLTDGKQPPQGGRGVFIDLDAAVQALDEGCNLDGIARKIDAFIEENMPEAKFYYTSAGSDDQAGFMSLFMETGSHRININFTLTDMEERDRDVWELANELRAFPVSYTHLRAHET